MAGDISEITKVRLTGGVATCTIVASRMLLKDCCLAALEHGHPPNVESIVAVNHVSADPRVHLQIELMAFRSLRAKHTKTQTVSKM